MNGFLNICGAFMCLMSVTLGAFGAHGLPKWLAQKYSDSVKIQRYLDHWEKAARYQMYHGLGALIICQSAIIYSGFAASFLLLGTALFSGSLYLLPILDRPRLGIITPIGGLSFMIGWVFVIASYLV